MVAATSGGKIALGGDSGVARYSNGARRGGVSAALAASCAGTIENRGGRGESGKRETRLGGAIYRCGKGQTPPGNLPISPLTWGGGEREMGGIQNETSLLRSVWKAVEGCGER